MISSMTGYGKGSFAGEMYNITVEAKSINSKQLDLTIRIPSVFRELETSLRNEVSPVLERGKVEINVTVEQLASESNLFINKALVKEYKIQMEELSEELGVSVPEDILALLLRMPEVFKNEPHQINEKEAQGLRDATLQAITSLAKSRRLEGEKLYSFFFDKLEKIRFLLNETEKFEGERIPKIRERLECQLKKLESIEYDKGRLEQELIFYIEKLDVTEEKVRLRSHLNYFEETMGSPDETETSGKGKKLGFIAQEMGREINTLGSKANDAQMQKLVVMMKDELEQIKEQVLNVL